MPRRFLGNAYLFIIASTASIFFILVFILVIFQQLTQKQIDLPFQKSFFTPIQRIQKNILNPHTVYVRNSHSGYYLALQNKDMFLSFLNKYLFFERTLQFPKTFPAEDMSVWHVAFELTDQAQTFLEKRQKASNIVIGNIGYYLHSDDTLLIKIYLNTNAFISTENESVITTPGWQFNMFALESVLMLADSEKNTIGDRHRISQEFLRTVSPEAYPFRVVYE